MWVRGRFGGIFCHATCMVWTQGFQYTTPASHHSTKHDSPNQSTRNSDANVFNAEAATRRWVRSHLPGSETLLLLKTSALKEGVFC